MKLLIVIAMMASLAVGVCAQQGSNETDKITPAKPPAKAPEKSQMAAEDSKPPVAESKTGGFQYKPAGRRDPFWNLLKGKSIKIKREQREGIAGLLIDELELEGIMTKKGRYIALFKGPDGKPYDIHVGDSVYDGEVIKIDFNSVVFKRLLTIALGGTKEKMITKRLIPEEEAAKK
jgi:Tfp pilus assembly protein PilP